MLHGVGGDKRLLWVVEHMCEGVHPKLIVGGIDPHRLLAHCRLVRISGRLVVVWKRDDRGTDTEDH